MLNGRIDLRSDTVTMPTDKMRKAMAEADVGDDVYCDDPTVNRLEAIGAKIFGKEAALFVPTGTMGNQLALFVHAERGSEVILPDNCHVVVHETGGTAIISGTQIRCIQTNEGEMPLDVLERTIRKDPDDIHQPKTALITYENADSDGRVRSIKYMDDVKKIADKYNLPVHIDGARIFNATTALGIDAIELEKYYDTISVCLSKGLCAPIGSLLIGSKEFIDSARRKRKILGGGMRQVGIIAAAGIIAIEEMTKRLQEDHDNAKYLANELSKIDGIEVLHDRVEINMVFFRLNRYKLNPSELVKHMADNNIIINGGEEGLMRYVVSYYVNKDDIDKVCEAMKNI